MKNKFLNVFFVVLIISCGNKPVSPNSLVGEYSDKKLGYLKGLYLGYVFNEFHSYGNSLSLRSDSTYTYINCSSITNGVWCVDADTLSLTCLDIKWKSDTLLNRFGSIKCGETVGKIYITKQGDLQDRFKVRNEDNPTDRVMYAVILLSKNE